MRRRFLKDLIAADKFFARRNSKGLRLALEHAFERAEDRVYLDDLIRLVFREIADIDGLPPTVAAFASAFARRGRTGLASPVVAEPRRRTAGLEFDFLGDRRSPEDWTISQFLSCLELRSTAPSSRAAVVGAMRDDGIYAIEWIAHYQCLGFDPVVVYSNDNVDSSERLLRRLAEHDQIIFVESVTSGRVRPEVKAFEHALHFVDEVRACEWALFVDSDELFVPAAKYGGQIGAVLDDLHRRRDPASPSAVVYNWLWFNSGMVFERGPGLLMDRFRYATPNWLTKPLVRLRDLLSMRLQHIPEMFPGAVIVDSSYRPIDVAHAWEPKSAVYDGGGVNHYWPKSFQEFSLKKARGDALPLEDDEYRRSFSLFFRWNAPETAETFSPPDENLLARVKERCAALRALPGVSEAEAEVERRFTALLDRYRDDGGLEQIYRTLRSTTEYGQQPTV